MAERERITPAPQAPACGHVPARLGQVDHGSWLLSLALDALGRAGWQAAALGAAWALDNRNVTNHLQIAGFFMSPIFLSG